MNIIITSITIVNIVAECGFIGNFEMIYLPYGDITTKNHLVGYSGKNILMYVYRMWIVLVGTYFSHCMTDFSCVKYCSNYFDTNITISSSQK